MFMLNKISESESESESDIFHSNDIIVNYIHHSVHRFMVQTSLVGMFAFFQVYPVSSQIGKFERCQIISLYEYIFLLKLQK